MTRASLWMGLVIVVACAGMAWGAPQETAESVAAQTPGSRLITFAGTLLDAEGQPRTGGATLTFSLYAQQVGGAPLWHETQKVAADVSGRYTVLLGATVPGGVPPEAFGDDKAQWLEVRVEGEAEQPRVLLVAVPYALKAADADTLGGQPIASFVLSSDLEKTVEKQLASVTTGTGGVAVAGASTAGTLGNEAGNNTWYGEYAGAGITSGTYNAFFGQHAGYSNAAGIDNAVFGALAGYSNTANYNTFVGTLSGRYSTTGCCNAFLGTVSGYYNTTGQFNTFIGHQAGYYNTTSAGSTFVGFESGFNSTGAGNTFFGYLSGSTNSTGTGNTFLGATAGPENTTGSRNTYVGEQSGTGNSVENNNTAIGAYTRGVAGITNATAIGYQAQVTQSNSVVLGSIAGTNGALATANVGIGTTAPTARLHVVGDVKTGDNLTGPNNVVMGSGTALPAWSGNVEFNNEVGVGFHFRTLTAQFDIGPGSGGAPTYPGLLTLSMDGKVGIGITSPAYKLHVAGDIYTTGTYQGSDLRLKDQVHDLGYGVREVLRLRPVSYRWKDAALARPTLGLIAQEVEPVLPELVARGTDEAGLLSVNYTGLIPVLVKAVQEQQETITELRVRLAALEDQLKRIQRHEEK